MYFASFRWSSALTERNHIIKSVYASFFETTYTEGKPVEICYIHVIGSFIVINMKYPSGIVSASG